MGFWGMDCSHFPNIINVEEAFPLSLAGMLGKQDAQHFDILLGDKSNSVAMFQNIYNAENMQLECK